MDMQTMVTQIENGFLVTGPNPMGLHRVNQTIYCADLPAVLECLKKIYPCTFAEMRDRQMNMAAAYRSAGAQNVGLIRAEDAN